ncbi:MAG TPA: hypothetical protein VG106_08860 [Vicinamibacterales bacterium]|nr:hypothetical protein [Vicinamibacterales bacterium]
MTARSAATIASLVVLCAVSACTNFYEIPIETPIQPKMDVSAFQRVLIAGFITGGTEDVDANMETVRLLRSQLRTKSSLRVIEAEVLPLVELASEQAKTNGDGLVPQLPGSDVAAPSDPASASAPAPATAAAPAPTSARRDSEPRIRNEKDLEKYQSIFSDTTFWKKIGEEYQNPLIVTGTVLFTPHSASGFVTRDQEVYDSFGRRRVVPMRMYMERKGFILTPKFIFIDGRTGATLYSETFREEILYNAQQNTPALSSYFELMDRLIPSFLSTLSTQKIRGTRVLLK